MNCALHALAETHAFQASAKACGMTQREIDATVQQIALAPDAGDVIAGSGGCRKVRVAGRGKGKSGGYRVVTLFGGGHMPVYLLWTLSKGDRGNFTDGEVAQMRTMVKAITDAHRPRSVG